MLQNGLALVPSLPGGPVATREAEENKMKIKNLNLNFLKKHIQSTNFSSSSQGDFLAAKLFSGQISAGMTEL